MKSAKKSATVSEVPLRDAFLEDAMKEPKRLLISDHIKTINLLRNEKRFTFREIAEWFGSRLSIFMGRSGATKHMRARRIPKRDWLAKALGRKRV